MNGYQLATGVLAGGALLGELWYEGVPQKLLSAVQTPFAGETVQWKSAGTIGNQGLTNFAGVLQSTWGQILVFSVVFVFLELLAAEDGTAGQVATALAAALFFVFFLNHGPTLNAFFNVAQGGIKK